MHFTSRGGVSVAELIVYLPSLAASVLICHRHGFTRGSGWIYTLILCLVRLVGACCQLTTYHDSSSGLIKATIILDSIGISPLLLATLGLLSRLVDSINSLCSQSALGVKQFRILQLLITVGLILSIAGGTSASTSSTGQITVSTTSKVGIILYIVAYAGVCLFCILSMQSISYAETGEKRIAAAVILALPFILVRLAYGALAVFVHNKDFNVVDGKVVILVVMSVLEELVVTLLYLLLGFRTEKAIKGAIESRPWKRSKDQGRTGAVPRV